MKDDDESDDEAFGEGGDEGGDLLILNCLRGFEDKRTDKQTFVKNIQKR